MAQVDREPQAGAAPTTGWLAGEVVVDEMEIPVTEAIIAAQSMAVGLYDPMTGRQVPLLDAAGIVVGASLTLSVN